MFVNNLYIVWFQVAEFEDDMELIHEINGVVVGSFATKIGRNRKML